MFEVGSRVKGKRYSPKIIRDILVGEVLKSDNETTKVRIIDSKNVGMESEEIVIKNEHLVEFETLQLGDIVRVRSWNDLEKQYGTFDSGYINTPIQFGTHMKECCGKICLLVDILKNNVSDVEIYTIMSLKDGLNNNILYWSFCKEVLQVVNPIDVDWFSSHDILKQIANAYSL